MVGSTGGLSHCVVPGYELGAAYNLSPKAGDGELKIISQGPSICILDHEADPNRILRQKAAWLFYKHLTNFENGLAWSLNGGYSPIRYSVMESPEYIYAMDPENAGAEDSLPHLLATVNTVIAEEAFANALYTTPAFKGSAEARTNLGGVISQSVGAVMQGNPVTRAQINEWLQEAWNNTVLAINK
jgi:ABC-type glycerol-3-phosphate transport system substrate-binding protein